MAGLSPGSSRRFRLKAVRRSFWQLAMNAHSCFQAIYSKIRVEHGRFSNQYVHIETNAGVAGCAQTRRACNSAPWWVIYFLQDGHG